MNLFPKQCSRDTGQPVLLISVSKGMRCPLGSLEGVWLNIQGRQPTSLYLVLPCATLITFTTGDKIFVTIRPLLTHFKTCPISATDFRRIFLVRHTRNSCASHQKVLEVGVKITFTVHFSPCLMWILKSLISLPKNVENESSVSLFVFISGCLVVSS